MISIKHGTLKNRKKSYLMITIDKLYATYPSNLVDAYAEWLSLLTLLRGERLRLVTTES